jgi:hypothetical protein
MSDSMPFRWLARSSSERAFTPDIWAHSFMGNVTAPTDEDGRTTAGAWFSNIAGLQAYPLNVGSWTAAGS